MKESSVDEKLLKIKNSNLRSMQRIDFNTGWREIEPVIWKLHRILDTERSSEENI